MTKQQGFINIPGWFFWLAPVGAVLLAIEVVRIVWWLYQNIEVTLK